MSMQKPYELWPAALFVWPCSKIASVQPVQCRESTVIVVKKNSQQHSSDLHLKKDEQTVKFGLVDVISWVITQQHNTDSSLSLIPCAVMCVTEPNHNILASHLSKYPKFVEIPVSHCGSLSYSCETLTSPPPLKPLEKLQRSRLTHLTIANIIQPLPTCLFMGPEFYTKGIRGSLLCLNHLRVSWPEKHSIKQCELIQSFLTIDLMNRSKTLSPNCVLWWRTSWEEQTDLSVSLWKSSAKK